ncbi:pirin family protein [Microbulbifer thermotolerans]|uniref:Pirin family protein n=1 Tax=Microbulbifer thermotolerans TaxID=252514 RepID=A0AB35HWI2_MICTH|nr:pirin family protein [Microbulbifer thermotolerans]MCX2801759.1 pirin family protein [Microbulbifer thermotolerans]MCX2840948.1 pirin family protein [Microbulbifer thermotolerans]
MVDFEKGSCARPLICSIESTASADGAGVNIQRVTGFDSPEFSPFLMLDEIRSDNADDYMAGFPPHPHRGIETLTYMLNGAFEHRDHLGNRGAVSAGGAQWMRAGRGIVHSEMPVQGDGGMHGFQLWINMPAADKMRPPEWRDIQSAEIPELALDSAGSLIRLIAGRWTFGDGEVAAPLTDASSEAAAADIRLRGDSEVELPLPMEHSALVYVYRGGLITGLGPIVRGTMLLYGPGESLQLHSNSEGAGLLCLHGRPLREPVYHYGPFVMNSREEIEQALRDYNNGTLTG